MVGFIILLKGVYRGDIEGTQKPIGMENLNVKVASRYWGSPEVMLFPVRTVLKLDRETESLAIGLE